MLEGQPTYVSVQIAASRTSHPIRAEYLNATELKLLDVEHRRLAPCTVNVPSYKMFLQSAYMVLVAFVDMGGGIQTPFLSSTCMPF